jgi:hypothetical protein
VEGNTQHYGTIGWAVKQMLNGDKVKRKNWGASPEWIAYVPKGGVQIPQKFAGGHDTGPFLVASLKNRGIVPWTVTHADLLAGDWEIVATSATHDKGSQEQSQEQAA